MLSILRQIFSTKMLLCICIGFASGMPMYVLIQMIPAWLRDHQIDLQTIGLFAFFSVPYVWKFAWAPILDIPLENRHKNKLLFVCIEFILSICRGISVVPRIWKFFLPSFVDTEHTEIGRRKLWAVCTQLSISVCLIALAYVHPHQHIEWIAGLSLCIAFFSASQDIVLDAYRRELLTDAELGLGNSVFVNAYRLSSIIPGSIALLVAEKWNWHWAHLLVACMMFLVLQITLLLPEPSIPIEHKPFSLKDTLWLPLQDFWQRNGAQQTLVILAFMFFYKVGDSMATALSTPFYMDLGFSKSDLAYTVKAASLWSSIVGGFIGGAMMLKISIRKALWYFGWVQLLTILGFAVLAYDSSVLALRSTYTSLNFLSSTEMVQAFSIPINHSLLFVVVSAEYLGIGLGTAAFVAFIAKKTNPTYTATQFALLTSISGLPKTITAASAGYCINYMGYVFFFLFCTVLAIPGLILLSWIQDDAPEITEKQPNNV